MNRYEGFARVHDDLYTEYSKNYKKYDIMASEPELNAQLNQTISKLMDNYISNGNFESAKLKDLAILCITKLAHDEFYDVTKLAKTVETYKSNAITVFNDDSISIE